MAIKYYDKAIDLARENEYIIEEALANELTAKYYFEAGNRRIAGIYMTEASHLYKKWGAKAKVEYLNETYPELLSKPSLEAGKGIDKKDFTEKAGGVLTEKLDMTSMLKASQAISCEIHLDRLLEKLMNIVIANAGAQKGFLLLMEEEELYLEGEAFADNEEVTVLQHIPALKVKDISRVIINYVQRVIETVVINDALNEEYFTNDEYIIKNRPKSIFCMPLVHQNKLSGILYLENNIAIGAFTPDRVKILEMLTGEIVVSIENAKLYKNLEEYNRTLEENVTRRTAEISQKNEQLNIQKEELRTTLENLKQSQFHLIQSEKMASLGQLVAGIAHEINNPVTFISAGVDSLKTNMEEVGQVMDIYHRITPDNVEEKLKEIERLKDKIEYKETIGEINSLIDSIKTGTERTTEIIKGLRTFSRLDEDILKVADIHESLNSTLILLRNKYKERIEVEKYYEDIPQIECYPGQLNQVFMNVLSNAIDAIEDKGIITVHTSKSNGSVRISIRDTGKGIPENIKTKIFEPFFTTKEVGQGTGLGLSISHGIIEKHQGSIKVKSEVGQGSEFIILLPVKQTKE
jgi:signal transduction histidine kinase